MPPEILWRYILPAFAITVLIETPILFVLLSQRHPPRRRIAAGVWLTACTYPIVVLVLPLLIRERWVYLAVAETFAPLAECAVFAVAFHHGVPRRDRVRDFAAIVIANLASFLIGESLLRIGLLA
jgi:hypothetical protein